MMVDQLIDPMNEHHIDRRASERAHADSHSGRFGPRQGPKRYPYPRSTKGCSVVFIQLVIRPFWAAFDLRTDHLFTKQLLCQLSYAGIITEG
jgi:hypothetical protein